MPPPGPNRVNGKWCCKYCPFSLSSIFIAFFCFYGMFGFFDFFEFLGTNCFVWFCWFLWYQLVSLVLTVFFGFIGFFAADEGVCPRPYCWLFKQNLRLKSSLTWQGSQVSNCTVDLMQQKLALSLSVSVSDPARFRVT